MSNNNDRNPQEESSWEVKKAKDLIGNTEALVEFWNDRYDAIYGTLLEGIDEFGRHGVIAEYIARLVKSGMILDVGCGMGILSELIDNKKIKYDGLDVSPRAINAAIKLRSRENVKFQCVCFDEYQSSNKYDAIIFNEVLYYLDIEKAISRSKVLLISNGIIIASCFKFREGLDAIKLLKQKVQMRAEVIVANSAQDLKWTIFVGNMV